VFVSVLILLALGGLMQAARSFANAPGAGTLMSFGFLLLASFFTGRIADRIGLPKLTGYLIVGVVAGPHVLELVSAGSTASLKLVSDTAVCLIALTAGSELNLKRIRPVMPTLRAMTFFAVLLAMVVLAGVLFVIRPFVPFLDKLPIEQAAAVAAMLGVALSAQSPAVVMALIAETRSDGPLSQVILGSVVIADLVVIVVYAIAATLCASVIGGGTDVVTTAIEVSWEVFGSVVFGFVLGMTLALFLRTVKRGAVLFTVLICVVVAEIGARIRLDPLIVLLASGIWLENFSRANAHDLLREIEAARLPLFLVFFSLAGGRIDIEQLARSIVPIGVVVIARAMAFRMGAAVACRRSHAQEVVTRYAWFGLVPQSGLALALALIIRETFKSSFGDAAAALMFGVVGTNELLAPIVLRRMLLRSGETGRKNIADIAVVSH